MQKWEYLYLEFYKAVGGNLMAMVNDNLREAVVVEKQVGISTTLNKLGSDGWELVGVSPKEIVSDLYEDKMYGDFKSTLYFKRPIE